MVGAVVVRDGRLVGQGWHRQAGGPHAEVVALDEAGEAARGATLFVSLEPCGHAGRTGPCTERIVGAGVGRVVAPLRDPNPEVNGRGFEVLRAAGVVVDTGTLAAEAQRLNEAYFHWRRSGRAFTVIKLAATLDGRLATRRGASRWITGAEARREGHRLRAACDAVLVGSGTLIADDPTLTPRPGETVEGPARLRAVADARLRTPADSRLATSVAEGPVLVYTLDGADPARRRALECAGVTVVAVPPAEAGVKLGEVLRDLARREILTLLVEGGGRLAGSLLAEGLADKVVWFTAPLIFGDPQAVPAVAGLCPDDPADAIRLAVTETRTVGDDCLVVGYPTPRDGET
jgi:diaminohydroxyphosphoribosylaminopyrimidine deaminase/5-amino-6-(5-phosphoribosylamino)uracil reductase